MRVILHRTICVILVQILVCLLLECIAAVTLCAVAYSGVEGIQGDNAQATEQYGSKGIALENSAVRERIRSWNQQSFDLYKANLQTAAAFADSALKYSERYGFHAGKADALRNLGRIFWQDGHYDTALALYRQSLEIYERLQDTNNMSGVLNNIGNIYRAQGDYSIALRYYLNALRYGEASVIHDRGIAQAYALNNIGNIHRLQRNYDRALAYYRQCTEVARLLSDRLPFALALRNTGTTLLVQKQYAKALQYFEQAGRELTPTNFDEDISANLSASSDCYAALGNVPRALESAQRALRIAEKIPARREIIYALSALARAEYLNNNPSMSLALAERAIKKADSIGLHEKYIVALRVAADAATALEKHKEANIYLERLLQANDSVYSLESSRTIAQLQIIYSFEQQQQQIRLLQKDGNLKQSELQREVLLRNGLILSVFVLIILALLILRQYHSKRASERLLQEQQKQLKQQAEELQRANRSLVVSNNELERVNNELSAANTFKMQMLSVAAHDLKNPLSAIIGFVDFLLSSDTIDPEAEAITLRNIYASGERMLSLVKDILEAATMEMGKMALMPEEFSLSFLLVSTAESYLSAALAKEQTLEIDVPAGVFITADEDRLRQVFDNLLSNAVKYSPHSKSIRVCLVPPLLNVGENDEGITQLRSDKVVRIEVQDEGPGFTEEDKSKLFQFFQRLSARPTGGETSNGVGLAIVKKIVEAHHGSLRVESEPGKGATFIVELPVYYHSSAQKSG